MVPFVGLLKGFYRVSQRFFLGPAASSSRYEDEPEEPVRERDTSFRG